MVYTQNMLYVMMIIELVILKVKKLMERALDNKGVVDIA